jgi:hypothetical protein
VSEHKTPFDEAVDLAGTHGWLIDKCVTKSVVVSGAFTNLRNVEVTLVRPIGFGDPLSGGTTVLVGQGQSIPAAVQAALGLPDDK